MGATRGDPLGRAAIGALLRTRRLVTVAQISKAIGPATHNVAEYQALIEGLKLAREYGVQRIRVYMDSELVVDQVNGVSAVRQAHLGELHERGEGSRRSVQELPHQLGAPGAERRGRPTREGCSRRAGIASLLLPTNFTAGTEEGIPSATSLLDQRLTAASTPHGSDCRFPSQAVTRQGARCVPGSPS